MKRIPIIICSPSPIICVGLSNLLSELKELHVSYQVYTEAETIDANSLLQYSIAIIDPILSNESILNVLKDQQNISTKFVAITSQKYPEWIMRPFKDSISVYDSTENILATIKKIANTFNEVDDTRELTLREKEIVIGIVKGHSNKEIANDINVSVNTVMTHRRNIAAKLHIHSPAGLTIYAIVKKLVNIEDINH
jgi:DNA-binding CsgD family transcriptional regulator